MRNIFILCIMFGLLFSNIGKSQQLSVISGYIDVTDGKLFYEIAGEGEYIVLLHDGLVHREIWDGQFPVLAKKYKVVRYDRRGYGKSTFPDAPFSHIEDLNQLLVQLKIKNAIVFGISGGGELAIDFTLKYPEKVNALVLAGAVVSGFVYTSHTMTRGGHVNSVPNLKADPQKLIQYFVWEDPYEIYSENIKAKEKLFQLLKANPNNVNFKSRSFVKPAERSALNSLAEIKVPALVLVGEFDMPDVHANAGVMVVGIPNAKREIIYNSGHLIPLEQPEAFNASVLKFLNGMEFFNILNSQGVDAAVQYYYNQSKKDSTVIMFEENEMTILGYQFLKDGKINEAIELFKLNTIAYPNSWNVFDSLGEAYMIDGNKNSAIKNYKKSLELNPENNYAKKMLEELESRK